MTWHIAIMKQHSSFRTTDIIIKTINKHNLKPWVLTIINDNK